MKFTYEATGIGSVPFKDAGTASNIIFENFRSIPFWPQLPKRSYLENMYVQFSENLLPGLVLNEKDRTIHVDTSKVAAEVEAIYGRCVDGDLEFFRISERCAEGLYEFLERLKAPPKTLKFAKGQVTGPVSYALSVTDENKKAIIYDKDLFEILTKTLVMKARWQIKRIKKLFPSVMIFIDEPYLVSIGSSFVNVNVEEAMKKLDELIAAIKKDEALVGVHCCGNTDWPIILKRDIDIISFDAYTFMKEFSLYGDAIKDFLKRGGTIAWGAVPSSDAIRKETRKSLSEKLKASLRLLADKGIPTKEISSLVTPSCGVGTLDETLASSILEATKALSNEF